MRRWLLMLMLIAISGCAQTLTEVRKGAIRNVAVISAIGDDVTLIRILGSGDEKPERVGWSFDRIATFAAVESVRALGPSASIVPLDYDPNVLAAGIHKRESFKSFADPVRIESALRQLTRGTSVDTIVLIARSDASEGILYYEGVGVMTERTFLPRAPITPFAALALFVLDAPTMQVLSKQTVVFKGALYNVTPLIQFTPPAGPAPVLPGFKFLQPRLQEWSWSGRAN